MGLLAAAATAAAVGVSGGSASASTIELTATSGITSCPSGLVCAYQETNFETPFVFTYTGDVPDPGYAMADSGISISDFSSYGLGAFNDSINSIENNTGTDWCFHQDQGYGGTTITVGPYTWVPEVPADVNNQPFGIQSMSPGKCSAGSGEVTGQIHGLDGDCLDIDGGTAYDHAPVDLWPCTNGEGQLWAIGNGESDTTVQSEGDCLGTYQGGTAAGTKVDMYTCNGSFGQRWMISGGHLINNGSGTCLDDTNWSTTGAQLQIWPCTNNANQQFVMPYY
jgi:hypothetical protein